MKIFYDPTDDTLHLCSYCSTYGGGIVGIIEDASGNTQLFTLATEQIAIFEQHIIGEY